ncbi:MAG: hypothetical protein K2P63_05270, partial [Lachnospiraceae bacterium]|nr:hypothetical protein [Lachnospiraceae bacterium]
MSIYLATVTYRTFCVLNTAYAKIPHNPLKCLKNSCSFLLKGLIFLCGFSRFCSLLSDFCAINFFKFMIHFPNITLSRHLLRVDIHICSLHFFPDKQRLLPQNSQSEIGHAPAEYVPQASAAGQHGRPAATDSKAPSPGNVGVNTEILQHAHRHTGPVSYTHL